MVHTPGVTAPGPPSAASTPSRRRTTIKTRNEIDGMVYSLTFEGSMSRLTVQQLKRHLYDSTGVPPPQQHLTINGYEVRDGSCSAAGIADGCVLVLSAPEWCAALPQPGPQPPQLPPPGAAMPPQLPRAPSPPPSAPDPAQGRQPYWGPPAELAIGPGAYNSSSSSSSFAPVASNHNPPAIPLERGASAAYTSVYRERATPLPPAGPPPVSGDSLWRSKPVGAVEMHEVLLSRVQENGDRLRYLRDSEDELRRRERELIEEEREFRRKQLAVESEVARLDEEIRRHRSSRGNVDVSKAPSSFFFAPTEKAPGLTAEQLRAHESSCDPPDDDVEQVIVEPLPSAKAPQKFSSSPALTSSRVAHRRGSEGTGSRRGSSPHYGSTRSATEIALAHERLHEQEAQWREEKARFNAARELNRMHLRKLEQQLMDKGRELDQLSNEVQSEINFTLEKKKLFSSSR